VRRRSFVIGHPLQEDNGALYREPEASHLPASGTRLGMTTPRVVCHRDEGNRACFPLTGRAIE